MASGPNYPWQQSVLDAFAASVESLPTKINLAEKAIAARLTDPQQPDTVERLAINEALRALRKLLEETKSKAAHFHIRWSSGRLDWERFSTRADAEASGKQLVRHYESYSIEEFNESCPQCLNFYKSFVRDPSKKATR